MAKRGFSGAVMRLMRVTDHTATVTRTERLTPYFLRIHLRSETLFSEVELAPTAWLRGWFPDPEGRNIEHQRGYTISSGNVETGEFSFDFVLHEPAGPASHWAQHCAPGDELVVNSLGSTKFETPATPPAGYLLIGDAAAIPALSAIVSRVPPEARIEMYLEEHQPADRSIPLPYHPGLRTHWCVRADADTLAAALETRDWSGWFVWVTPESASLRRLRSRLRGEFNLDRGDVTSQAYWVEGRAMGKQRGEAAA